MRSLGKIFKNARGQSLLEITITLGISVIIILAITITTIQGLQSSQFSQNQVQATKYAQDGLEKIRLLKVSNTGVAIGVDTYYWVETTPGTRLIWNASLTSGDPRSFFAFPNLCTGVGCSPVNLPSPSGLGESISGGRFHRKLVIINDGVDSIKITCIVSWNDISGYHESNLVTVLTNN